MSDFRRDDRVSITTGKFIGKYAVYMHGYPDSEYCQVAIQTGYGWVYPRYLKENIKEYRG